MTIVKDRLSFRMAAASDLTALADIRWEHWSEGAYAPAIVDHEAFRREFAARVEPCVASGLMTFWVAEFDGQIVSTLMVERVVKVPKPSKLDDGYGYVTFVHIRAAYRNMGIGSALLRRFQAWAKEMDLEFLVLWPSEKSVPLYHRLGFGPGESLEFTVRPYVG